jgi:hypothetical protein
VSFLCRLGRHLGRLKAADSDIGPGVSDALGTRLGHFWKNAVLPSLDARILDSHFLLFLSRLGDLHVYCRNRKPETGNRERVGCDGFGLQIRAQKEPVDSRHIILVSSSIMSAREEAPCTVLPTTFE